MSWENRYLKEASGWSQFDSVRRDKAKCTRCERIMPISQMNEWYDEDPKAVRYGNDGPYYDCKNEDECRLERQSK